MMRRLEHKTIPCALAFALLVAIALSGGYALKMAIDYSMGPSAQAAAKLQVFQADKEYRGIEYHLTSETCDAEGNVTYIFEAIDRDELRIVVQPTFYPFIKVEFIPAGFIHTYGPGWDYEVVNRAEWQSAYYGGAEMVAGGRAQAESTTRFLR